MLKLLLGRSGTGKSAELLGRIRESGGVRAQVLIVPEQHSHDSERQLCAVAGNQSARYAEVLSFTRLAGRSSPPMAVWPPRRWTRAGVFSADVYCPAADRRPAHRLPQAIPPPGLPVRTPLHGG